MKIGFYPRLAADGIRKNKRMYLPYLLTCIGMVMMTYIIAYLKNAEAITLLPGSTNIVMFMSMGIFIIIFFAALFLLYTNSFLIRRRKKEFGLYNILGMGKGNIGRILFWESVYTTLISLVFGLLFGIAFSKLAELGFVNIMKGQITYSLSVPAAAVWMTVIPFVGIFGLLFLNTLRQVWFSSAISLLRSENTGEKPPKANWIVGILGVLLLGGAYYLAVTIKEPVSAVEVFLIAVLMVILATYLIMIAGSVLLCRILQKHKRYYYRPDHFVSVSSMVYRMKRNGAGLASICILATMVLVMISSTSALFIGEEDVIRIRYPREINAWFRMDENRDMTDEDQKLFEDTINNVLEKHNAETANIIKYRSISTYGLLTDTGEIIYDKSTFGDFDINTFADVHQIYLVPVEDYNSMMGKNETLAEDEVLIYAPRNTFRSDTFGFVGHQKYRVKEIVKDCFQNPDMSMDIVPSLMVISSDINQMAKELRKVQTDITGKEVTVDFTYKKWYCCFDTSLDGKADIALHEEIMEAFGSLQRNGHNNFIVSVESREFERQGFYSLYGGLFYLGIILSIVFLFAAVLNIYYKQISEGYEDQSRFEIMQNVGMTKKDIRRSINSQLLTVFFLPLIGAGLHLAFAFPIIEKLLLLFNLNNHLLFICTTLVSFLVFALFYIIVYRITANAYYKIVSDAKAMHRSGETDYENT